MRSIAGPVCCEEKLGSEIMQFPLCDHGFCKECVTGHLTVRILGGFVHNTCLDEKCTTPATRAIVSNFHMLF